MMADKIVQCDRCGARVKVAGPRNPLAKMLRRAKEPKGLCINCATHDWLRNTYPVNALLENMGPHALLSPHIREQFAAIMKAARSDAKIDEINWNLVVENWDLPWPHKVKRSAMNPFVPGEDVGFQKPEEVQKKLKKAEGSQSIFDQSDLVIHSFEELDEIEPGLGDRLRAALNRAFDRPKDASADAPPPAEAPPDPPPEPEPKQRELFEDGDA